MNDKNCSESIIDKIGKTPIVKLNNLSKNINANLFAKCEFMNPGGSIKDRIAAHILAQGEKNKLINKNSTIIEATSGNTGIGVAMIASIRGYKCIFIMADKQSEEKQTLLRKMGARVITCPTNVAPEDSRSYYSVAKKLAKKIKNSFYVNQYYNPENPETHYRSTGPEIWQQCGSSLDAIVLSIGTGGTVSGLSKFLKEKNENIQIIGVDPIGSIYFDTFYNKKDIKAAPYYIEGIGEDFLPGTMNLNSMDEIIQVTDQESFFMAKKLIKKEGLLIGGSSGSAFAGTIKYLLKKQTTKSSKKLNILTIFPDSYSRYICRFLNDNWSRLHGFQ